MTDSAKKLLLCVSAQSDSTLYNLNTEVILKTNCRKPIWMSTEPLAMTFGVWCTSRRFTPRIVAGRKVQYHDG